MPLTINVRAVDFDFSKQKTKTFYTVVVYTMLFNTKMRRNPKNGFTIFSGAVAVGSKGGLMMLAAAWAVAASM